MHACAYNSKSSEVLRASDRLMRPKRFRRSGLCLTHSRTFAHRQGKCPLIAIARRKGPVASPAASPKSTSSRIDTEPRRRLSPLAVLTGPQRARSTGGGRPALATGRCLIIKCRLQFWRLRRRPVGHKRAETTAIPASYRPLSTPIWHDRTCDFRRRPPARASPQPGDPDRR